MKDIKHRAIVNAERNKVRKAVVGMCLAASLIAGVLAPAQETQAKTINRKTVVTLKSRTKTKANISWKKIKGISGYQVRIVSNSKTVNADKKKTSAAITLKSTSTAAVKVRGYKKSGKKKTYTKWSKVLRVPAYKKNTVAPVPVKTPSQAERPHVVPSAAPVTPAPTIPPQANVVAGTNQISWVMDGDQKVYVAPIKDKNGNPVADITTLPECIVPKADDVMVSYRAGWYVGCSKIMTYDDYTTGDTQDELRDRYIYWNDPRLPRAMSQSMLQAGETAAVFSYLEITFLSGPRKGETVEIVPVVHPNPAYNETFEGFYGESVTQWMGNMFHVKHTYLGNPETSYYNGHNNWVSPGCNSIWEGPGITFVPANWNPEALLANSTLPDHYENVDILKPWMDILGPGKYTG